MTQINKINNYEPKEVIIENGLKTYILKIFAKDIIIFIQKMF